MKKIIGGFFCALFLSLTSVFPIQAELSESKLYATSAVLMDAETGRVLYGKKADVPMAMASTTKIMTCILLLENGNLEDELQVSAYAASMPKVKLYIKKGETYKVKDLLYSLMLESHNDSAVALAEYIGRQYLAEELKSKATSEYTVEESKQAVAAFAALMNEKAVELGCEDTYFITPNGLDATETITGANGEIIQKEHHTTATDLARIMAYCINQSPQKETFLTITRAANYSFGANNRSYSCVNHNAFLNMMEGALSGKTGFTNKAGYCYVGALEQDDRTYTLALLACGWPNNKTYKWADSKTLFTYGLENYQYRDFAPEITLASIPVEEGASPDGNPYRRVNVEIAKEEERLPIRLLTNEQEQVVAKAQILKELEAPVTVGTKVGSISYFLIEEDGTESFLAEETICTVEDVERKDFSFLFAYICNQFFL
uniref:D-alanyl-D-alanine carboxypeptidase family protein n=1 Tax=Acetatifactor sp. TaxID=1872090 RepID=UPI0040569110